MADARFVRTQNEYVVLTASAVAAGEVWQLGDGRAAVYTGSAAASSGVRVAEETTGKYTITKTTGISILDGGRVYWDHSANSATYKKVNDRDFYLGRSVGDYGTSDAAMVVDLNIDPPYDLDLAAQGFNSVLAGTPAASAFGYPRRMGGAYEFELTATSEAQKVDAISVDGFAKGANAIVEIAFRVLSDGAGTVVDASLGIANATHATDADSITEHLFVHLDANNVNINLQSKDTSTTVAATDTTIDYTEGSTVACRVEVWMDLRDPADVQCYVNGVLALGSTVFNIDAAVGPLFLLAHLEKTSSADTYKLAVDWLRARFCEQHENGT